MHTTGNPGGPTGAAVGRASRAHTPQGASSPNIAEVLVAEKTTGPSAEAILTDHGNSLDPVVTFRDGSLLPCFEFAAT
ncbi:MAG: hypothetical protein LBD10_09975 [Desulfobulbus sp.]|jgi:hypothetical protein|uniref:hypothetical protein n=1 Tax=Desulfobulbus sp. TaxID=895 RepID=UPI0028402FE3|nr:hypothetical protein [Desulfobulbus sp.]MDR2550510.1 hypothetical protein [Desulfobulbus sp.]